MLANPQAPCLQMGAERWTWGHAAACVAAARGVLRQSGAGSGDRVMVSAKNRPAWVWLKLACQLEGIGFVPVSYRLSEPEAAQHLALVKPALWWVNEDWFAPALKIVETNSVAVQVLSLGLLEMEVGEDFSDAALTPERGGVGSTLLFTGGTTGLPKAVVRRAGGDEARTRRMAGWLNLSAQDRHLLFAPLYHSGPNLFLNLCLFSGAQAVLFEHFSPQAVLDELRHGPPAVLFGVPTHFHRLCRALKETPDARATAANVRVAVCAGAPLGAAVLQEIENWLGREKLYEFYGSTETGTVACLSPQERALAPGSVGCPPPGTRVKVLDENGHEKPVGETGFLYVHNDTLMEGYFEEEAATRACFQGEFLTVWDIGRVDEKGFVYLCDRKGDLIISGGVNLYPAEIEAVIEQLPQVAHVAVVGLPHEDLGEIAVAVIEWHGAPCSAAELAGFLEGRLARHKHPRAWHAMTEMPLSPVGKVLRAEARWWILDKQPGQLA